MASYDFHPDALFEFEDATRYYLEQASPIVASAFVGAVESAIKTVIASPMVWRVMPGYWNSRLTEKNRDA